MKKWILFFLIVFILCWILESCGYREIYKSGTYTIQERKGDTTKFKGIKQKYLVPSDTLKPGDKIKVRLPKITPYKF